MSSDARSRVYHEASSPATTEEAEQPKDPCSFDLHSFRALRLFQPGWITTEARRHGVVLHEKITEGIRGAAIEVHGILGPGLLESDPRGAIPDLSPIEPKEGGVVAQLQFACPSGWIRQHDPVKCDGSLSAFHLRVSVVHSLAIRSTCFFAGPDRRDDASSRRSAYRSLFAMFQAVTHSPPSFAKPRSRRRFSKSCMWPAP